MVIPSMLGLAASFVAACSTRFSSSFVNARTSAFNSAWAGQTLALPPLENVHGHRCFRRGIMQFLEGWGEARSLNHRVAPYFRLQTGMRRSPGELRCQSRAPLARLQDLVCRDPRSRLMTRATAHV